MIEIDFLLNFPFSHHLDEALQDLESSGDLENSIAKNLRENLSPRDLKKLRGLVKDSRDFFGEETASCSSSEDGASRELLERIFRDDYPIYQLELLLSLERFLCSSHARWGASGSPVISTKVKGGVLVGMFLRGFPECAETGADFLVEQSVKMPDFHIDPNTD